MFRITLAYFVRIGEQIQILRQVSEGQQLGDVRHIFYSSLQTFEEVLSNVVLGHSLRATYEPLRALIFAIQELNYDSDDERLLENFEAWELQDKLSKFYTVLSAEFQVANAYLVLGKSAYDTRTLLLSGEQLFPEDLLLKVPEVIEDVRGAAKCLAYEMGTACGFHTLRALEAVLNKYWQVISKGEPIPEPRNIGNTLNTMAKRDLGSEKFAQRCAR